MKNSIGGVFGHGEWEQGEREKSFPLSKSTRISHKLQAFDGAEGRRGRGAEGIELGTLNSPLLPCSPAQAQALRGVVRNPGVVPHTPPF
ncbi:hypothetical protein [Nostoc sp. CALU 1950]|uniref:hypothetical protein n=1 Tax=Nostoc sp. CALU 1950 TaxID=3104321 RepID=UPI003EC09041